LPGKIYARKSARKAHAIVSIEESTSQKLVATDNGVTWGNAGEGISVIAPALWVFEKFAEVVEVEPGAESVPSRKSPGGIGKTRCPYHEC
jgi:hypothetical protein